jgi:hypothetical protein
MNAQYNGLILANITPFLLSWPFPVVVFFSYSSLLKVQLLLTLVHLQSNPLLLFVIIFCVIEHQSPHTDPSNFNNVSEVVAMMFQLPFWLAFELWLIVGLVFIHLLLNQGSHPYIQEGQLEYSP